MVEEAGGVAQGAGGEPAEGGVWKPKEGRGAAQLCPVPREHRAGG